MVQRLPLTLLALPFVLPTAAQIAFTYPSAIPPHGVYTFDVRVAAVALQELDNTPPFDISTLVFDAPTVIHRAFSVADGTLYQPFFVDATDCAYEYETGGADTAYTYVNVGPGAAGIMGTGSEAGGISIYEDWWNMFTFPSNISGLYTDEFTMDGLPCNGSSSMLAKGDLVTPFGTTSNVVFLMRGTDCGFGEQAAYYFYSDHDIVNPLARYDTFAEELTLYTQTGFSAQSIAENVIAPLRITPNPARDEHILLSGAPHNTPCVVTIVSADGKDLLQRSMTASAAGELTIEATDLAPGTYAVAVACKDGIDRHARLVIVR